jgi:hypothetical protein
MNNGAYHADLVLNKSTQNTEDEWEGICDDDDGPYADSDTSNNFALTSAAPVGTNINKHLEQDEGGQQTASALTPNKITAPSASVIVTPTHNNIVTSNRAISTSFFADYMWAIGKPLTKTMQDKILRDQQMDTYRKASIEIIKVEGPNGPNNSTDRYPNGGYKGCGPPCARQQTQQRHTSQGAKEGCQGYDPVAQGQENALFMIDPDYYSTRWAASTTPSN